MNVNGEPAPVDGPQWPQAGTEAPLAHGATEREAQLRLALEATGLALWTWDIATDVLSWAPPPTWLPGQPPDLDPVGAMRDGIHPDDRDRVLASLASSVATGEPLDVEFRITLPDGQLRWLLTRGTVVRDERQAVQRMTGILLDITERALARTEHLRLIQAERRATRRAGALQRVAAALSEAATTEQVAAVMVEESLRSLGVDAARIELRRSDPITGESTGRLDDVTRTAGIAQLLASAAPPGAAAGSPPGSLPGSLPGSGAAQVETTEGRTLLSLVLANRGRYRGRWTLAWRDPEPDGDDLQVCPSPWSPDDWTSADGLDLLRTLATECGQAIDRAELYEQQRDIATVLQRTLLPSILPEVAGADIAARYQPGGQGVDVGGDWYDVISLPEGRTGLVIGDVEGHSAAAAAVMGQVRNALRAYAVEGSTPAIVMERVNRLLTRLRVSQLVSCCYVEFAASEGTATVVLAGHPPPLLVTLDGQSVFVAAHPNLMLGVEEAARYVETTVLLDPGACILLYTDGLIETVSRSLPEGLDALQGWARGWDVDDSPDELVERLIRQAREGWPVLDDVAVLALRYHPVGRVAPHRRRTVRRTFPLDPSSASAARRFVADVLGQWDLAPLTHHVTLMASELVTNSVLHTSGELELALSADEERLRVEVVDHSERLPALQNPDAEAPGGRGLLIIEALATRWGVDARGAGKAVWFEVLVGVDAAVH